MIRIAQPLIGDEEKSEVLAVLDSGMLAQGPRVEELEKAFAEYCGVKYAVAASNGTTALHLALLAHDVGPGDEVITSPFSFIATANAIRYVGAKPVFADIEPKSFNIDPDQVASKVTPRTKALLPVHLFGQPADMEALMGIAREHSLAVIEDACQAHGADYHGKRVGSFATGCFSFYPTKNMTTAEGGMVTVDDPEIADRVRVLRNHGMRRRYHHEMLGFNYRMTDVHAAIGLAQLRKLERFNQSRISNAGCLSARLPRDEVICPQVPDGIRHVFNQYTIRVPRGRDELKSTLEEAGIDTSIYYPIPIHLQGCYVDEFGVAEPLPEAEAAAREVLSLPVHPGLSPMDLDSIASAVRRWAGSRS